MIMYRNRFGSFQIFFFSRSLSPPKNGVVGLVLGGVSSDREKPCGLSLLRWCMFLGGWARLLLLQCDMFQETCDREKIDDLETDVING